MRPPVPVQRKVALTAGSSCGKGNATPGGWCRTPAPSRCVCSALSPQQRRGLQYDPRTGWAFGRATCWRPVAAGVQWCCPTEGAGRGRMRPLLAAGSRSRLAGARGSSAVIARRRSVTVAGEALSPGAVWWVESWVLSAGDVKLSRPVVIVQGPRNGLAVAIVWARTSDVSIPGVFTPARVVPGLTKDGIVAPRHQHSIEVSKLTAPIARFLGVLPEPYLSRVVEMWEAS